MAQKNSRIRHDLRWSLLDGVAFGGMVGFGETYLPAFVLAVGLGEMVAGLVASVPLVAGGIMQLISPWAVRKMRSHRRWVVACAAIQALTFIPLVVAAVAGTSDSSTVLLIAALYWASGLATGPAWNTWIGTLVPCSIRHQFFANRTRLSQLAVFIGFLSGGICLQISTVRDCSLLAFAVLFGVAGLCRLISTWSLWQQSEPVPVPVNMRKTPWQRVIRDLKASGGGKLLSYLIVVQAAVQMAGPYFTPFMLKRLEFEYWQLVILISVAFLTKVISLPIWGRVAKSWGAQRLLWIGGVGIVPLSGCWILSQHFAWLCFVQLAGGVVWAAYELAFFLLFFESIDEDERTSILTIYNLLNTVAWVAGSLLGGLVLYASGTSFEGYLIVFGLSSVGRLVAVALLARIPKLTVESNEIGLRTVAVRPGSASLDSPVLPSLPDQTHFVENDNFEDELVTAP